MPAGLFGWRNNLYVLSREPNHNGTRWTLSKTSPPAMSIPIKPLAEINHEAIQVLSREIGLANTLRFINQFTSGTGNYTEERREHFEGMTLDDILAEVKRRRTTES